MCLRAFAGARITIVHDMVVKAFPQTMNLKTKLMLKLCLKRSCKRADKVVTVSQFSKDEIIKYLGIEEQKIIVMPNGVDHSVYHTGYAQQAVEEAKRRYGIFGEYYLYLGTLEPRKNIERMVQAYGQRKGSRQGPNWCLPGAKAGSMRAFFRRFKIWGCRRMWSLPIMWKMQMCRCS